jgi:hypothetical protein
MDPDPASAINADPNPKPREKNSSTNSKFASKQDGRFRSNFKNSHLNPWELKLMFFYYLLQITKEAIPRIRCYQCYILICRILSFLYIKY